MKSRIAWAGLASGLTIAIVSGCWPGLFVSDSRLEALYEEIQTLAADRSSTSDSECGVVYIGACGCLNYLVYSRATVDEAVLLEKVQEYNRLERLRGEACLLDCMAVLEVKSENGMCVAVYP
jgi:hypothetical protein